MVSQQRRKEKKKKAREEKGKAKVLRQRAVTRKAAKLEKMAQRIENNATPKITPYKKDQDEAYQAQKSRENLEHNVAILRALEEQYKEEMSHKQNLNDDLEAEGYSSLEEKMNALHKQAIELAEVHEKDEAEKLRLSETKEFVEDQQKKLAARPKKKGKLGGGAKYRCDAKQEEDTVGLED